MVRTVAINRATGPVRDLGTQQGYVTGTRMRDTLRDTQPGYVARARNLRNRDTHARHAA